MRTRKLKMDVKRLQKAGRKSLRQNRKSQTVRLRLRRIKKI